ASITASGSQTSAARITMAHPSDQITPPKYHGTNVQAYSMTVNSSAMSHSPRVHKNRATRPVDPDRDRSRKAPVPARKKNIGAQKCVIQRVKKSAGQVTLMSSGSKGMLVKKSRVWSIAIDTMISPRKMSIEDTLALGAAMWAGTMLVLLPVSETC